MGDKSYCKICEELDSCIDDICHGCAVTKSDESHMPQGPAPKTEWILNHDPWHPIETAPKDGTMVLLWASRHCVGNYRRIFCAPEWVSEEGSPVEPTHWMPLPNKPKGEK
jgi:hypothetical protein